jgi:NTP pyrophosphatase (non-canonical NTP hydrolase)
MYDADESDLFDSYQDACRKTAVYPGKDSFGGLIYCTLKLNGEAGEVAEKIGKIMRDKAGVFTPEDTRLLMLELGDVLWYVAMLASELDYPLHIVAERNLEKLAGRKARGTLQGNGDER